MSLRVFAQEPRLTIDTAALARNAQRYFDVSVNQRGPARLTGVTLELSSARLDATACFDVTARAVTADDVADAWAAERASRAGGMASLAERCPTVWEVQAQEPTSALALQQLAAVLASVALGPVLPSDELTLYGVRGALERAEALAPRR